MKRRIQGQLDLAINKTDEEKEEEAKLALKQEENLNK